MKNSVMLSKCRLVTGSSFDALAHNARLLRMTFGRHASKHYITIPPSTQRVCPVI